MQTNQAVELNNLGQRERSNCENEGDGPRQANEQQTKDARQRNLVENPEENEGAGNREIGRDSDQ
jgi:hypothetical protein